MKIKKGKKYLTSVSGLGNPDETLVSETLQILEINGDDCIAKGIGTGHVYKIKKTEIENKVISKSKKYWGESFDDLLYKIAMPLMILAVITMGSILLWIMLTEIF